ncbi:MAG: hypothetical protein H7345_01600, partial [Rubritepida sp.]|nr:hypothetical protein [Rubritepida sp.]
MDIVIRALHSIPNWASFGLVTLTICTAFLLMPALRKRMLAVEKPVNDAAMDGVKTVTTFLVLVLAFSLNLVMGQHRQVEEQVQREATLINQLDRGLLRTGPPELVALRPVLIAYASSLVQDEWPRMAVGGRSQEAYTLYN